MTTLFFLIKCPFSLHNYRTKLRENRKSNSSSVFTSHQLNMLRHLLYSLAPSAPILLFLDYSCLHHLVKAWGIFLGKFLDRDIQNRVILLIKTTEHEVLRWSVSRQYLICCFILLNHNMLYFHM